MPVQLRHAECSASEPPCYAPVQCCIHVSVCLRDGLVYGCGSTEHGELPYLRFSGGAGDSDCDDDSEPRSEICVPTRLRLPFLQVLVACSQRT